MPAARKPASKASPKPGEAARAEVDSQPAEKSVTFRGTELTLPPQLPPTFLFDITELEAPSNSPMPVFRLLRSVIGPEQFNEVRNALTSDDAVYSVVDELLADILDQYGLSLGESEASPGS